MAFERNYRAKVRISALINQIAYEIGDHFKHGKENTARKVVVDSPVLEMTNDELGQRMGDVSKVLQFGWELIPQAPPIAWMGDVSVDPVTGFVTMSGRVRSNNAFTTCVFWIDIDPTWDTAVTVAANESPVTSVVDEIVTLTYNLNAFRGMRFYFQLGVTDARKTMYSMIKSLVIPMAP